MATRKRFTKALVLRITAVGLFFGLGTFAVMHSIQNQKEKVAEATETVPSEDGTNQANDVPVMVDPGEGNKVATVGGTETTRAGFNTTEPKSSLPGFQASTGSAKSGSFSTAPTQSQLGTNSPITKKNAKPSIPPFRKQETKKTPAINQVTDKPSQFAIPSLPPTKPTTSSTPSSFGGSTGSFNDTKNSGKIPESGKLPDSGKALLPPMRPPSTSEKQAPSGFSTTPSFNPPSSKAAPANQLPPLQPNKTSSTIPSTSTTSQPNSGGFNTSPSLSGSSAPKSNSAPPAMSKLPTSPSTFNATPPSQPTRSSVGNASPLNSSTQTTNPLGQPSSTKNLTSTPKTSPPSTFSSTTPRSSTPATNASSRNSASPGLAPRSSLSAAPLTSTSASAGTAMAATALVNKSQPTPGDRRLEGLQVPALAVQKIAPREIQVNREATFELIVKNTGRVAASNVQVHDQVPQGTQLIETIPPAQADASGKITWTLGSMNPGQQTLIKMKVLPQQAGNIGSTAHVTFGALASAQTLCTEPKLSIRHEVPASVLLGQKLLMTIFVENNGSGAAENVVLQTDVPEGLAFSTGQKELEYAIGTLPPGQSRMVQLPLQAAKVGQAQNVLVAHGAGKLRATDSVNIRVTAPKLNLQSEGPNRKFLNRQATHTITLGNNGTAPATNVQLVAKLPRGLQFTSANNQGQYDPGNHAVIWRLAKLDPQKSGSVQLKTLPVATGQLDIAITAGADLNQRQQEIQTLNVEQLTELYFDIEDTADAIEVGTNTNFRVRIINQGRIPAKNVEAQVEFASAIKPLQVQGGIGNQIQGQIVKLNTIPSLQPGQEISFIVTANALQAGDHRTVVSVRSADREIAVSKEESTHVYSDR